MLNSRLLLTHRYISPNRHSLLRAIWNHYSMLPMSRIHFRMKLLNSSGPVSATATLSLSLNAQRTMSAATCGIEDACIFPTLTNSACTSFTKHTMPQQQDTQDGLRH